jgi:hypothetical protein
MTPATVEVRIPVPDHATGQEGRKWAKLVTSVEERAKTGHDWAGDWLDIGKLVDLPVGSLVVVGRSVGSRKYGRKTGTLYVVDPDGDLIRVGYAASDEWAVMLRDVARRYLDMPAERRPIEACRQRAAECRAETERSGNPDRTAMLERADNEAKAREWEDHSLRFEAMLDVADADTDDSDAAHSGDVSPDAPDYAAILAEIPTHVMLAEIRRRDTVTV